MRAQCCTSHLGHLDIYVTKRRLLEPVLNIIKKSHRLEGLSLGCMEDLVYYGGTILEEILQSQHALYLRTLGLASIKYDPDDYDLYEFDTSVFSSLRNLQVLSIDYDYMSDEILSIMGRNGDLQRLVVHVHGILDGHPGTSEEGWTTFTRQNPTCELRLNLIHSYDGVDVLNRKILKAAMPLTHFRVFFCEKLNLDALHSLHKYRSTLRSIWWVDSFNCSSSTALIDLYHYDEAFPNINPLIMCSWLCPKLQEIVLFGYNMYSDDIYGLAKLRGEVLKNLQVASSNIIALYNQCLDKMQREISQMMGKPWHALEDHELHPVILNPDIGDSDEFILPVVLQDLAC